MTEDARARRFRLLCLLSEPGQRTTLRALMAAQGCAWQTIQDDVKELIRMGYVRRPAASKGPIHGAVVVRVKAIAMPVAEPERPPASAVPRLRARLAAERRETA